MQRFTAKLESREAAMAVNHADKQRFVEPRRALVKAMARRARTSHLGSFQILPEHVSLCCLAQLPREDHDAVADCSTGFRALMRSERFLKARRAENITEEALVIVGDCLMALVSGRMWRRLAPMPPEIRIDLTQTIMGFSPADMGTAAIGSELFVVGDVKADGTHADVTVYDAIDDDWFTLPRPPAFCDTPFAVACAGRLYVGGMDFNDSTRSVYFRAWDPDAQEWLELPAMPRAVQSNLNRMMVVVTVDNSLIFICSRSLPDHFCVFDVEAETWSRVDIPIEARPASSRDCPSLCVDGDVLRMSNHHPPYEEDHMAYDTVNGEWFVIEGGNVPRHNVVCRDSGRVLTVVNHDGPDDILEYGAAPSSGGVKVYRRGHVRHGVWSLRDDLIETNTVDLPVAYNAVRRVFSVAMP